jgi:penicillin-binding protein 1A
MTIAVANRPVEQFQTQVPMPDWQLTPEEEMYGDQPVDMNDMGSMVDENGMPIGTPPSEPGTPQQQPMVQPDGTGDPTQQELDQAFPPRQQPPARTAPAIPPQRRQPPLQTPPQEPHSTPQADPSQARPNTA